MKLHIGCGSIIRPGYVNIDEFNPHADRRLPIQALDYPDDTLECIEGYMVLEHLSLPDARKFVRTARRMLRTGGRLILECPDLAKVARLIVVFSHHPDQLDNGAFGLRGIFGESTEHMTVGDYHKWGYTPASAEALLRQGGFTLVTITDGISHYCPLRDMRIEAVK